MAYQISTKEFEEIVKNAIEQIPALYKDNLNSVGFFVEDMPTKQQINKLKLRPCDNLFGLFEGVPKTENHGGYALTLPSKVTIFKKAHEDNSNNLTRLEKQVYNTVWHEVAHYYGLDHQRIAELERK